MPFGAELGDDGARFRLWAPAARRVDLCLEGRNAVPMQTVGPGFFAHRLAAPTGTRYGYRIDGSELIVPDPAARANPDDVHGMSMLVDPREHDWQDGEWRGRPWDEAVIYELHVGTFSEHGDFDGVIGHLRYLAELGVTAVELMPVAEFAGRRGWGYDGVLQFAPESAYGGPAALKRLVEAAHAHGLMILLDVVYNHFGPDGNYLGLYAPQFFTKRIATPWGAAIDFQSDGARTVREFFIHNALYWLEEFNIDGLRLDAVHSIFDESEPHILEELADRVRAASAPGRHVHLILENDDNEAHYLRDGASGHARYEAQWNDDFHHAAHVFLTGELDIFFADYGADPLADLGRALAEGFVYQGQHSQFRDRARGEPSDDLPTRAFVNFLQNHDQIGNRAFGERITDLAPANAVAAIEAVLLLAPAPPMLFMGQEFAASSPFNYFCDFEQKLGAAVAAGRRREFRRHQRFTHTRALARMPHPNLPQTFEQSKLDWSELDDRPHAATLERYRKLLAIRGKWLTPRLPGRDGAAERYGDGMLRVRWALDGGGSWCLLANLASEPAVVARPAGRCAYASHDIEISGSGPAASTGGAFITRHAGPDSVPAASDDMAAGAANAGIDAPAERHAELIFPPWAVAAFLVSS